MSLVSVSYPYCPGHLLDNHAFLLSKQPGEELAELSCSNQGICTLCDLSQYPNNGRARGQLQDGSLPTITTNCSKFFSEDLTLG